MTKIAVTAVAVALVLVPAVAGAQSEPAAEETVIERILELQGEIDELAATLSPAARAELERRLGARPSIQTALAERQEPAMEAPAAPSPSPALAAPVAPAPAVPEPAVQPAPAEAPVPPYRRRPARGPRCNFLDAFDSNGDGKISALDRHWRHLFLWSDQNGDRTVQEGEVASAYERNVREIAVDLGTFTRKKGTIGEVRIRSAERDGEPLLDVRGDGFGGADDAALVVDATRLRRSAGPELLAADGAPLEGFQPFREGRQLRAAGGEVTVFRCP